MKGWWSGCFSARNFALLFASVADDGKGFDPSVLTRPSADSNGLAHIPIRMQAIGGDCAIQTSPKGTTLVFSVPIGGHWATLSDNMEHRFNWWNRFLLIFLFLILSTFIKKNNFTPIDFSHSSSMRSDAKTHLNALFSRLYAYNLVLIRSDTEGVVYCPNIC